jgi:hypothetical protein
LIEYGLDLGSGRNLTALFASAKILVAEEPLIGFGDGILGVIMHNEALFV